MVADRLHQGFGGRCDPAGRTGILFNKLEIIKLAFEKLEKPLE
jgi:hypothetical protein